MDLSLPQKAHETSELFREIAEAYEAWVTPWMGLDGHRGNGNLPIIHVYLLRMGLKQLGIFQKGLGFTELGGISPN